MLARAFSCTTSPCLPRLLWICPLIALYPMTRVSTTASSRFHDLSAELYQNQDLIVLLWWLFSWPFPMPTPPKPSAAALWQQRTKHPKCSPIPSHSPTQSHAAPLWHRPHPTPAHQHPQPRSLPLSTGGAVPSTLPGPNAAAAGETGSFPLPRVLSHADTSWHHTSPLWQTLTPARMVPA